jgi:hypothetical protein
VWSNQPAMVVLSSIIDPVSVPPGGVVHVERTVKRARPDCGQGTLTVTMIDSHRVMRVMEPVPAPSGTRPPAHGVVGSSWPVPETMPPGETVFRSSARFSCYPFFDLWPTEVTLPDLIFYVSPEQGLPRRQTAR